MKTYQITQAQIDALLLKPNGVTWEATGTALRRTQEALAMVRALPQIEVADCDNTPYDEGSLPDNAGIRPGAKKMSITETLELRKTNKYYSFEQWLGFLDQTALTHGWKARIAKQTGAECWKEYYEDGYTPFCALAEDCGYA